MKVIALVENARLPGRGDLGSEHGLALCIFFRGQQILFDTGISGVFHSNAQKLNVDTAQTTLGVISHHHFDHGGGLATFFEANQQAQVYLRNSRTEDFYFEVYYLIRRWVGLDKSLFQRYPHRFTWISQPCEIAPGVFILTQIGKHHPPPKGNRHLFAGTGWSRQRDDFEHELILVLREDADLMVFSGCSHHGILNMLDAVLEQFPDQTIRALFGGFHLIDLPLINNMAGSRAEVEELGRAILKYPVEKVYTGHCTGNQAYRILKGVMGAKLEYFATGCSLEL
jgi:7,8-dihydropterin-6-yl-methyl-4-(beta-D-ribofuranosyl)aminobenzene 5'-phosphate synthase